MKTLSDDEYVEWVRRRDRSARRFQWFWLGLFIAMVAGLVACALLPARIPVGPWDPTGTGYIYGGFFVGVPLGIVFGVVAVQAGAVARRWLDARNGSRTERLLLKYHDERVAARRQDGAGNGSRS